jgi:mannose-1-phosphate guanylyltransferase/mannose-6-phosphate isomerase
MHVVILAGGEGSRLWPMVQEDKPKPLIQHHSTGNSFLKETMLRVLNLPYQSITIVTHAEMVFRIKRECEGVLRYKGAIKYLLEPVGRGTAASIASTCLWLQQVYGSDAMVLILPSDHVIEDISAFKRAVGQVCTSAFCEDKIVLLGVKPTHPETGYGYIEQANAEVVAFYEKPTLEQALLYVDSGAYLWNSGIMCFKAVVMLNEMVAHCPEVLKYALDALNEEIGVEDYIKCPGAASYARIPEIAIDHAVLEKSQNLKVVASKMEWSDVGDWKNLSATCVCDDQCGNVIMADAVLHETRNCYINSQKVVATLGVSDLVIVDTPEALLVANKNEAQHVGKVQQYLHDYGCIVSKMTSKSWGNYAVLAQGDGFKIKKLEVLPLASISLQTHQYRDEHWFIISGIAYIRNGDELSVLGPNESVDIKAGDVHKLTNCSTEELLVVVEIQTGRYLEEDDITRL